MGLDSFHKDNIAGSLAGKRGIAIGADTRETSSHLIGAAAVGADDSDIVVCCCDVGQNNGSFSALVQIAVDKVASVHGAIQLGQCFVIGHIELFCQIANQNGAGSVGGKDGGKPLWQSDLILIEDAQEEHCAEHDKHDEIGGQAGAQLGVSAKPATIPYTLIAVKIPPTMSKRFADFTLLEISSFDKYIGAPRIIN